MMDGLKGFFVSLKSGNIRSKVLRESREEQPESNAPILTHVSSRVRLPFDVICQVLVFVDWDTLKAISLLCWEVNTEANKRLWRRVRIDIPDVHRDDPDSIVGQSKLALVLNDPSRRGVHVQEMDIAITNPVIEVDQFFTGAGNIIHRITSALMNTPKLHTLCLYILDHGNYHAQLTHELSTKDYPFHLSVFASNVGMRDLEAFFALQSSIEEYEILYNWQPTSPSHQASFPATLLPSLCRVRAGDVTRVAELVRGRPVTSIHVEAELRLEGVPRLAKAIATSSVRVTDLGLVIRGDVKQHLELLVSAVPSLTSLTISSSLDANILLEGVDDVVRVLSEFPRLEKLRWSRRAFVVWEHRHAFMVACTEQCPSIRTIIFGKSSPTAEHYVRTSSSWSLQPPRVPQA